VTIEITDRSALDSIRVGLEAASALRKLYPRHFDVAKMIFLVGNAQTIARLERGDSPGEIIAGWKNDLDAFRRIRAKYVLYP